jgi:hypothetical protein
MTKQPVWRIKKAGEHKYVLVGDGKKVATMVFTQVVSVPHRGFCLRAEIYHNGNMVWRGIVGNKTECRLKLSSIGRQYAS